MKIVVQTADFDVGEEHRLLAQTSKNIGAIVSFIGLVRDFSDEETIKSLTLEHYPQMTEKALQGIAARAQQRWDLLDLTIIHRIGTLIPQDQIVLVAISSEHRLHAFNACEFVMDYLKTQAPFWKKEVTSKGERWVDAKLIDDIATQRWEQ